METVPYVCSTLLLYSGLLKLFLEGGRFRTSHAIQNVDIQQICKSGTWLCLLLPFMSFLLILRSRFSLLINAGFMRLYLIHEWLQSPSDIVILYMNLGPEFLHYFSYLHWNSYAILLWKKTCKDLLKFFTVRPCLQFLKQFGTSIRPGHPTIHCHFRVTYEHVY